MATPDSLVSGAAATPLDPLPSALNTAHGARHCRINIPIHAFDVLGIDRADYTAQELLADAEPEINTLDERVPFITDIEPLGAVIWKLTSRAKKKSPKNRALTAKKQ